jgi:hypothetical protein
VEIFGKLRVTRNSFVTIVLLIAAIGTSFMPASSRLGRSTSTAQPPRWTRKAKIPWNCRRGWVAFGHDLATSLADRERHVGGAEAVDEPGARRRLE